MAKDIKLICEYCGKEFYAYLSQAMDGKSFCSSKCYHDSARVPRIEHHCICGKIIYRTPHEIEMGSKKFCSQQCYHKSRIGSKLSDYQKKALAGSQKYRSKNNVKGRCLNCGKEFWLWPSEIRRGRNKYCSNECKFSDEDFKIQAAQKSTGKHPANSTLRKMSERMASKNNPMYGKPCPRVYGAWYMLRDGSKQWLRSSYEIRVATILDRIGINWKYESARFELENETYAPDFLIDDSYFWEVKGFMRHRDQKKIEAFLKMFPDKTLKLIGQREIEQLEYYIKTNFKFDLTSIGTDLNGFKSKVHYSPDGYNDIDKG